MQVLAVLPPGLEKEGAEELSALGAKNVTPLKRAASFEADLSTLYRIHLLARLPFRILREMARFSCHSPETLYLGAQNCLEWERWLNPSMSFRVDVSGHCPGLTHSHFTALQVKNALVDFQKNFFGERSQVNLNEPDLSIHLHLNLKGAILSFNGSAKSMHRRGYKAAVGDAPIKENLAAGLIRISQWNGSVPLIDPMCGSGTLLIEAASLALKLAPGLNQDFLFTNWPDFNLNLFKKEQKQAKSKEKRSTPLAKIIGCENNHEVANQAQSNVEAAGLYKEIKIEPIHFKDLHKPCSPGVIVCNPPYGKRIGKDADLYELYKELGDFAKSCGSGWQLWVLSGNPTLTKGLRLKCNRRIPVSNGGIDCRWLHYLIH